MDKNKTSDKPQIFIFDNSWLFSRRRTEKLLKTCKEMVVEWCEGANTL
jgi:hypothetical protein